MAYKLSAKNVIRKKQMKKEKYGTPVKVPKGLKVHSKNSCTGPWCCIHRPSIHKMNDWPAFFRADKEWLVERICQHGIGHPDPDSVLYHASYRGDFSMGVHGCDGCCIKPKGDKKKK